MWFYTKTWLVLSIKLQVLALVTLFTHINNMTKYITNILSIIFWYCLLAPVANVWKQTHLKRFVLVQLEQILFYQINSLIAGLCMLQLYLKMSITISNWGVIWKCKGYARKSQNYATTIQIILKILTCGQWSSGLRRYKLIVRILIQTPLNALQPLHEVNSNLQIKT